MDMDWEEYLDYINGLFLARMCDEEYQADKLRSSDDVERD